MDAVRFNQCSPSFGSIQKSAVEKAIKLANGELSELARVKSLVEAQKSNQIYDIEGLLSPREVYNYLVVKRGLNSGQAFMRLDEASNYATMMRTHDIREAKEAAKKMASKPDFDKLASELLADC